MYTVLRNDFRGYLLNAVFYGVTDTGNKYEIAGLILKRSFGSYREGYHAPVDAVAAIALRCIFIAYIGRAAENLLAGCRLFARRSVAGLVGK